MVDKRFSLSINVDGQDAQFDVNMGSPTDVHRIVQIMKSKLGMDDRTPKITPINGNKLRARKLVGDQRKNG